MSKTIKNAKTTKAAATGQIKFVIKQGFRPQSGRALASYTAAWLTLSGIDQDTAIPAKVIREIAGDTAYSHHTKRGNFKADKNGVTLTAEGEHHFGMFAQNRNIKADPELFDAYVQIMTKGTTSDKVGIKNADCIKVIGS